MVFNYDPTIPNPPNDPADDVSIMQTNSSSISGLIAVDHVGFNVAAGGTHKQVTFSSNNIPSATPTFPTAFTALPTLYAGTPNKAQLFFYPPVSSAAGSKDQYKLTGTGSVLLLGGIILKWGLVTIGNGNQTEATTFVTDFPNNCFNVQLTPTSNPAGLTSGNYPGVATQSVSGFTASRNGTGTALTYFYTAIGN